MNIWKALWRNLYQLLRMVPAGKFREQVRKDMRDAAKFAARDAARQKASKA